MVQIYRHVFRVFSSLFYISRISGDNTCCRKILLATNSEHRNVQSDIWGEYTICNRTYDDNRAGIITYMNANKIEFFGGKGRYDIMWRIQEKYPGGPPKLITAACKTEKCPTECHDKKWLIVADNAVRFTITLNITCVEDSSTLVVFTGQDLVSSVASLVQESTPSVVFNDQALTPSVAPATQDSTKTISSQSYGGNTLDGTTIALITTLLVLFLIIFIGTICVYKWCQLSFPFSNKYLKRFRGNISETSGYVSRNLISEETYLEIDQRINPFLDLKQQANLLSYDTKREIPRSLFTITTQIGKGNFGNVSKGELNDLFSNSSVTEVAIKSMNGPAEGSEFRDFMEEIKIMSYVRPHLNLVSMIGSSSSNLDNDKELCLILEFCPHGDLKNFLVQNKNKILYGLKQGNIVLSDRCLVHWSYEIAQGMKYLSAKKIMHGDLAARNILLSESPSDTNRLVAKIADFGLSKKFYDNLTYEKESRLFIPWKWMAPEYLTRDFFMINSDVWSFGVVLWEMLSFGRAPYGHQTYDEVEKRIEEGYRLPCPMEIQNIISWSPEMFYNEITHVCFKADPNDRGSFSDVVNLLKMSLYREELDNYRTMEKQYNEICYEKYIKLGQRNL